MSYLCILSSNFRRCAACKVYYKISKFEFLAFFFYLNHCWHIIKGVLWHWPLSDFTRSSHELAQRLYFKKILPHLPWANELNHWYSNCIPSFGMCHLRVLWKPQWLIQLVSPSVCKEHDLKTFIEQERTLWKYEIADKYLTYATWLNVLKDVCHYYTNPIPFHSMQIIENTSGMVVPRI